MPSWLTCCVPIRLLEFFEWQWHQVSNRGVGRDLHSVNKKQSFITAYHPAANELAERANRRILQVLRPIVNDLHDNWEDWLPQIAASINASVNDSTGKSPHYILYEGGKCLPYDLLTKPKQSIYNINRYAQQQMHTFSNKHSEVRSKLKATKVEMMSNQHKRAVSVAIHEGDTVTIKLWAKFVGPYRVNRNVRGNRFEVLDPNTSVSLKVHSDRLKVPVLGTCVTSCAIAPLHRRRNDHFINA